MGRKSSVDMTQGPILRLILTFSIPLLLGNLFQELYLVVDSIIVGNFCDANALAAVGSAESPSKVMLAMFRGLSVATTVLVSQAVGAGEREKLAKITATSNTFLIVCAVPISIAGAFLARPILTAMHVEEGAAMEYAVAYMVILMLGTLPMMGYNQNAGLLRGMGDGRSPLLFLLIASIGNIVLDFLFVGGLHWGTAGAAAATVLAQLLAWGFSIVYIRKYYPELDMHPLHFRIYGEHLRELLRIGIPTGLTNSIFVFGQVIVTAQVNLFGSYATAGYTCAKRMDMLAYQPVGAMHDCTMTFVGQNIGAKQPERTKKGVRLALISCVLVDMAVCVLILLLRNPLLGLFTKEQEVITIGGYYLTSTMLLYWMYAVYEILSAAMQGAGAVRYPTITSVLMFWGCRIPLVLYFAKHYPVSELFWPFPISWAVAMILSVGFYSFGKWRKNVL